MLGLRTENVQKNNSFSVFAVRLADCVITNIRYASDIEDMLQKMSDPFVPFEKKYKSTPLENANPIFDENMLQ